MKKSLILLSILVIGIIGFFGIVGYQMANKNTKDESPVINPVSFVTISINPEVELALDENDKVLETVAINSDGDVLLSDLELVGLNIEEATEKIIDSTMETGYLDEYNDENIVIVDTINNDEEIRVNLEEKVMNKMNAYFEAKKVYPVLVAKGVTDELKTEAASYNISNGKMLLIQKAVTLDETLVKDDLIDSSIQDIQKLIKSYVKARHDALKQVKQNINEEWQEQKNTLKQNYLDKIEKLKETIIEEHSEEFENMTTVQRDEAIQNYLIDKKEKIKSNINEVKEELNLESENKKGNYPTLGNSSKTIKEKVKERIQNKIR